MKCPHCQTAFHDEPHTAGLRSDVDGPWLALTRVCPACKRVVIELICAADVRGTGKGRLYSGEKMRFLSYPKTGARATPPTEVPPEIAEDYNQASLVFADSPKASAALSRRCLQNVLREKAGITPGNLANEIDQVIRSNGLPSYLAEAIDAIRNIGNFAAHPTKSTTTGEIVSVEPGEAEWNLDVLAGLFDFYFVQPEVLNRRRLSLNSKLKEVGKPPVK